MARRLLNFYQRHPLISTNLNILASGVLAIMLAKWPVQWVSNWIGEGYNGLKVVLAALIDAAFDGAVYLVLHWIANHWRPYGCHDEVDLHEQKSWWRKYIRSVSGIQLERLFLFPVFYGTAMGGMYALMHFDIMREGWAFALAFFVAICVTRIVHTIYWIKTGRFRTIKIAVSDADMEQNDKGSGQKRSQWGEDPAGPGAQRPL
jgi:hypothetical protein